MVKQFKVGQVVDMQKKMYVRVNIQQLENPSTAIVSNDFDGESIDVLYFKKTLFDAYILPRIEAHHELSLRLSLLKKNRFFKQLSMNNISYDKDNNKMKNLLTKIALMMTREKMRHNDTILTCKNDGISDDRAQRRESVSSMHQEDQESIYDNNNKNNAIILLFNGKVAPFVTLKHSIIDKNGCNSKFPRTVKTAILYEEGELFGMIPEPQQLHRRRRQQQHNTTKATLSSLDFKVESSNATVFRMHIEKLQSLVDRVQDVKCKIMMRDIKKYLNHKKQTWINFADKERQTQTQILGMSSVHYKETLRKRHVMDTDLTGGNDVVDELEDMFTNFSKNKMKIKKTELGIRGLIVNGKIARNRRQQHSNLYKPLLKMISNQFVASEISVTSKRQLEKNGYSMYDRSGESIRNSLPVSPVKIDTRKKKVNGSDSRLIH
jgi:hypothetical protein